MHLSGYGVVPGLGANAGHADMQPAGLPRMAQVPGMGAQDDPRQRAMRALLGLSTMGDEQAMLERQMGLAEALRSTPGGGHSTGIGAGLGALAQGLGGVVGGLKQAELMKQMQSLNQQRGERLREIAPLLGELGPNYRMFDLLK